MGIAASAPAGDAIASTLRWWRDAGVDTLIDEVPRQWLAQTVAAPRAIAPPAPAIATPLNSREALVAWLMTGGDVPEGGPPARRVAPSGDPMSGWMVLTDLPETADSESGQLLSGALAPLFEKMLAALGRDRSSVYLASLCPGRPPGGRLGEAGFARLAETARAHVKFVAPQRLWLLGASASRAILGMTDIAAHGKLHNINLDGVMIDVVATAHPRLLESKEQKARAWATMKRLVAGETA